MRFEERIKLRARSFCRRTIGMSIVCDMVERQPVNFVLPTQFAPDASVCFERGSFQLFVVRFSPFAHLRAKTISPRGSKLLALRVVLSLSVPLPPPLVVTRRAFPNSTLQLHFAVFEMFDTQFRFHIIRYCFKTVGSAAHCCVLLVEPGEALESKPRNSNRVGSRVVRRVSSHAAMERPTTR